MSKTVDKFEPRGLELDLKKAVAVLLPEYSTFPAERRAGRVRHRPGFAENLDLTKFPKPLRICRTLAENYYDNLMLEADATRPAQFLRQLDEMVVHAGKLAKILDSLKGDALFVLTTRYGVDEQTLDQIARLTRHFEGGKSSERPFEGLSRQLKALRDFLEIYAPVLKLRLGKDHGGPSSVRRRLVPSAIWLLIGESWSALSAFQHLNLSGLKDGDLAEFVEALHSWVTGKTNSFAKNIRRYASLRRRHAAAVKRQELLAPHTSQVDILALLLDDLDFELQFGFPRRPHF